MHNPGTDVRDSMGPATAKERQQLKALAKNGNQDAVQFLKDIPHFMGEGACAWPARRILAASGDERAAQKLETQKAFNRRRMHGLKQSMCSIESMSVRATLSARMVKL